MRREGLEARPQGRVGALKKPGKQAVGHRPKGVTFEGAAPRSDSRPTSQERKTRRRSTTETQDRSLPAPRSAPKEQNLPRPTSARPPSPLDLDQSARPRSAPDDTNLPAIVEADNRGEDEPDDTSLSEVDNPVEEDEVEEIGQIAERQVAKQRGSWWSNYVVRHNNLHKIVLWKQQLQARLGYEVMKKVKRGAVNRNAPLRKVIEARIEKKKAAELKSRRYVRGISHGEEAVLQTVSTLRGQWPAVPRVWQYCLDFIAFLLARTDVTQLAKCASVCHVWQQACLLRSDAVIPYANDAVFVNGKQTIAPKLETLHIRDGGVISLGKFLGFLSVAQNLTRMELCKCKILTDTSLGRVAGDCSSLQNLKVTEADRLCAPTLQSSTLKELTFSWCPFLETSYLSCSKLSEVSFDNCIEVGDSAPEHVLEGCPQLDAFSITGSDNLRDPQFFHENLKRLQLERCERLRNPRIITRSLEEIGFSGSFVLETPEIMSNELKRCKLYNMKQLQGGKLATDNLEGLSLSGGKMLQDRCQCAFLNFIEECPSLADLYLSSMPKLRYVQLSSFKNITALAFENCQGLNDASMKLLFQEFNISLRRVSFEQCNLIVSPAFLFNDGLESFSMTNCQGLISIRVSGSKRLARFAIDCPMMQSLVLVDLPILKKIEQHAEAPDFKLNPCRFMSLAGCLSFGHRQIKQLMEDFPVLESFVGPECAIPLTSGVLISKPIGNDVSQLDSGQRKTVLARGFARKIPPLEKEQANKKTHVLQKAKQDRQAALVLQQQMAAKSAEHVASVAENQRLERNREEFQEQEKAEEKAKQDKVQYIEDRLARRALRQRMEGLYKVEAPKLPKLKNPFRSSKLRL